MNNRQKLVSRYSAYKDSGIEWLGDVPEHWSVLMIKNVYQCFGSGSTPESGESKYYKSGTINWLNTTDLKNGDITETSKKITKLALVEKSLRVYPIGTLAIAMYGQGDTRGNVGILGIEATTNQAACMMYRSSNSIPKYMLLWFVSKKTDIREINVGATQPNMNKDFVRNLFIALPPLAEQKTIAQYLDIKTAQIDRKIDLLTQKATRYGNLKQSLINETVTRGLDKSVPMKDSEIEWIGDVPEHWEVKHLKNLAEIKGGKDSKEVEQEEGDYPVYGSGGIFGRAAKYLYKNPSVLLGRKGTVDKPLFVTEPFWSVDTMFYTDIKKNVDPRFFYYQCLIIKFGLYQYGSAVPSMAQNVLRQILFPTPNYGEQKAIADYLDVKTAQIAQIIQIINTQIEKLKELRKTLINDVVTGKIKVINE